MWRLVLGLILVVLGAGGASAAGSRGAFLLLLVFAALVCSLVVSGLVAAMRALQANRNRKAYSVLLSERRAGKFVLFLRSFETDHAVAYPGLHLSLSSLAARVQDVGQFAPGSAISDYVEVSSQRALGRMTVIGLAGPSAFLGPAQVAADDQEWRQVISELCADAKAIVFVLGGSCGLLWELELLLRSQLVQRTVFLVPPISHFSYHFDEAASVVFDRTKKAVGQLGIELPPIDERACVFILHPGSAKIAKQQLADLNGRNSVLSAALEVVSARS